MPKSFQHILLWTDFDKMNDIIMKTQFFSLKFIRPKMYFYFIEKFSDYFTLRPSNLNITLTYVIMDNFCPCLYL